MDLPGKTVLVTGGGSGIGRAIALAFAHQGARVAIAGRNADKLRQTAEAFQGEPAIFQHVCDVADRTAVAAMFERLEQQFALPDVLVNNAGVNIQNRSMAEMQPDQWDRILAVNVTGAYNCVYYALPAMRARGSGLIVNISSIAGKRALQMSGVAYCAAKFAMTALGTAVGLEERAHGIRVTNIYPGEVNTPILAQRPTPVPAEKLAQMLMPEDIADMVIALAKLPDRAHVRELVITPLYQEYA